MLFRTSGDHEMHESFCRPGGTPGICVEHTVIMRPFDLQKYSRKDLAGTEVPELPLFARAAGGLNTRSEPWTCCG